MTLVWSPHILFDALDINLIKRWQPSGMTLVDPNPDYLANIKKVSPNTKIVVRPYKPDSETDVQIKENPKQSAKTWIKDALNRGYHLADYLQLSNEVLQDYNNLTNYLIPFYNYALDEAERVGIKLALFNFSVGNLHIPNKKENKNPMIFWEQCYPTLRRGMAGKHLLSIHEYTCPTLTGDGDRLNNNWLLDRYMQQVFPRLPKDLKKLKVMRTEAGIDHLLQNVRHGYQFDRLKNTINTEETKQRYLKQLEDMDEYQYQWSDTIISSNLFTFGSNSDWVTYDHLQIAEQIVQMAERKRDRPLLHELAEQGKPKPHIPSVKNPGSRDKVRQEIIDDSLKDLPESDYMSGVITAPSGLNLRDKPNGTILLILNRYDVVNVFQENAGWSFIKHERDGKIYSGWAYSRHIRLDYRVMDTIKEVSARLGISQNVIDAIARIESNYEFFVLDKPIIRFEAHVFNSYIGQQSIPIFTHSIEKPWTEQKMLIGNEYKSIHTGLQRTEYQALNRAKQIDDSAAYKSISMGAFQILGFHFRRLGYSTPKEMFEAASNSEKDQVEMFFRFIETDERLLHALKEKDFRTFVTIYNGSGQVDHYLALIEEQLKKSNKSQGGILEPAITSKGKNARETTLDKINHLLEKENDMPQVLDQLDIIERLDAVDLLLDEIRAAVKYLDIKDPDDGTVTPVDPDDEYFTDFSNGVLFMGVGLEKVEDTKYYPEAVFTTYLGSWEPEERNVYDIEQRFRDKYLKPFGVMPDGAGGDRHIHIYVYDKDGNLDPNVNVFFVGKDGTNYYSTVTKDKGRADMAMYPSSSFSPERNDKGWWQCGITDEDGGSWIVKDIGLPNRQHVSTNIIMRARW